MRCTIFFPRGCSYGCSYFQPEVERQGAGQHMDDVVKCTGLHVNQARGDQANQPGHDQEKASVCCNVFNHDVCFCFPVANG